MTKKKRPHTDGTLPYLPVSIEEIMAVLLKAPPPYDRDVMPKQKAARKLATTPKRRVHRKKRQLRSPCAVQHTGETSKKSIV